jgi:hypothetical protein
MSDLYITPEREAENPASNYNFRYRASLHSTNNYVVSAIPFVTSSTVPASGSVVQIDFAGQVTKYITIKNVDNLIDRIRIGFSENGVRGTNYFVLEKNESFSADVKVTKLFLMSEPTGGEVNVSVFAGLTGISAAELPSNWSGSLGVG